MRCLRHCRRPVQLVVPVLAALGTISCPQPRTHTSLQYVYPIEQEVARINRVSYPEDSYTVQPGDTPAGVAAKLDVPADILYEANAIDADTKLVPGDVLVIARTKQPASAKAGRASPEAPEDENGPDAAGRSLVSPSGAVRAVSGGRVTAVYRKYTSLGDVVIIDDGRRRVVYSGDFEPVVVKGAEVRAGDLIGSAAAQGGVKVRFFEH